MKMRAWHRWAAIPAGLFLFFVSLTGVLLHLDMMRLGQNPPGHEPPRREVAQPIPSDKELAAMITRLADAARGYPSIKTKSLQIDLSGPRVVLVAGAGGPPGSPQIKLDALTGERIVTPPAPKDFHYILQDLHAGYFLGWTGRVISVLCGICLLVLSATGLQLWWSTYRRRRDRAVYWK